MIFFHGHIFDLSEYFTTDSDHLLKCREISNTNWLNYILVLMFNCVFSVVHILSILAVFVPGRESAYTTTIINNK